MCSVANHVTSCRVPWATCSSFSSVSQVIFLRVDELYCRSLIILGLYLVGGLGLAPQTPHSPGRAPLENFCLLRPNVYAGAIMGTLAIHKGGSVSKAKLYLGQRCVRLHLVFLHQYSSGYKEVLLTVRKGALKLLYKFLSKPCKVSTGWDNRSLAFPIYTSVLCTTAL